MITITTKNGKQILLDDVDADLAQFKWSVVKGYVTRSLPHDGTIRQHQNMAEIVLERILGRKLLLGHQEEVDHIDLNPLNNQRYNLRVVNRSEQCRNREGWSKRSRYKGVYPCIRGGNWFSMIKVNKKTHYLGVYGTEIEAAKAYNEAAKKFHGRYARLNSV